MLCCDRENFVGVNEYFLEGSEFVNIFYQYFIYEYKKRGGTANRESDDNAIF